MTAPKLPLLRGRRTRCSLPLLRPGTSLVEMNVTLTVIAILVTLSVPSYQRAMEQSRADAAGAQLRVRGSAERYYWLEYQTYSDSLPTLQAQGLLDAATVTGDGGYLYSVAVPTANEFVATATRTGSQRWVGSFSIDQDGEFSGVLSAAGEADLFPGFQ